MHEDLPDLGVVHEDLGEKLGQSAKASQRISYHDQLVVVQQLVEGNEGLPKPGLDVKFIRVVAETAEKENSCLPLTGVATLANSRHSRRNLVHHRTVAALHNHRQGTHRVLPYLGLVLVRLAQDQHEAHDLRKDLRLGCLHHIGDLLVGLIIYPFANILHSFQVF